MITQNKLSAADYVGKGISELPAEPELTTPQMQQKFDELVKDVVAPKYNALIDELNSDFATKSYLAQQVSNITDGMMAKSDYDSSSDGIVDHAALADSATVATSAENGFSTCTHSKSGSVHQLSGVGAIFKFAATADYEQGDSFTVNGESMGAELQDAQPLYDGFFRSGHIVSGFVNNNTLNFSSGAAGDGFTVTACSATPTWQAIDRTFAVVTGQSVAGVGISRNAPALHSNCRNVVVLTADTAQNNSVTFTKNDDGSFTLSGTAGAGGARLCVASYLDVETGGRYTVKGTGKSGVSFEMDILDCADDSFARSGFSVGSSDETLRVSTLCYEDEHPALFISVAQGICVDGVMVYAQIERGQTLGSYSLGTATGQIWIQTGSGSSCQLNVLKNGRLDVHPVSVKQYSGAAWEEKTAYLRSGGSWIEI